MDSGVKKQLFVRHVDQQYEDTRRLLKSITLKTLQRAKAMDPDFKTKLFEDGNNETGVGRNI